VATAGHQIEGNNVNADFWLLEISSDRVVERSADAWTSYHRYEEESPCSPVLASIPTLFFEWRESSRPEASFRPPSLILQACDRVLPQSIGSIRR